MRKNSLRSIASVLLLSSILLLSGCGDSVVDGKEKITSAFDNISQDTTIKDIVDGNSSNIKEDSNSSEPVVVFKADAGEDQVVIFDREFTFNGSKSTGDIVSYEWIFNGHTLSDTSEPTYTRYATQPANDYVVTLKVTDSSGNTSSDDVIITVIDPLPTEISVEQLKLLMKMGVTYIDVRHEQEWTDITPIEGSHKISYENYDIDPWLKDGSKFLNLIQDKNQEFVLICKGGVRAKSAAEALIASGYSNVHWLTGGILAWNESK